MIRGPLLFRESFTAFFSFSDAVLHQNVAYHTAIHLNCRIASHQITSHHITSHHIALHHITLHYVKNVNVLDTLNVGDGEASKETSVHLTVGVDTHIWGLNFASLRDSSFKRSGLNDKVLLTKLDGSLYWELQVNNHLLHFYEIFFKNLFILFIQSSIFLK